MVPKRGVRLARSATSIDGLAPAHVSQPGHETNSTNEAMHRLVPAVDDLSLRSPAVAKSEMLPCEGDSDGGMSPQSSAHASFNTSNRPSHPWGKALAKWEQHKSKEGQNGPSDDSPASVAIRLSNETSAASSSVEQINFQDCYPQHSDVDMDAEDDGTVSRLPTTPYLSARSSPVGQVPSVGDVLEDLRLAPTVKPKAPSNARQLLQVQTYSAAILGGEAMLAKTRTRQQAKVHTVGAATVLISDAVANSCQAFSTRQERSSQRRADQRR